MFILPISSVAGKVMCLRGKKGRWLHQNYGIIIGNNNTKTPVSCKKRTSHPHLMRKNAFSEKKSKIKLISRVSFLRTCVKTLS